MEGEKKLEMEYSGLRNDQSSFLNTAVAGGKESDFSLWLGIKGNSGTHPWDLSLGADTQRMPQRCPRALLCPGTWWHSWGHSLGNHISILAPLCWNPFLPYKFSQLQSIRPLGFGTKAGRFSQPQKGKRLLWSSLVAPEFMQVRFICLFFFFLLTT